MTTVVEANTIVRDTWPGRVQRAADLGAAEAPTRALLVFYAALLRAQRELYEQLRARADLFGSPERDVAPFRTQISILLDTVVGAGAVVTRDLPAGVVAAGAPAKALREIGDDDRIDLPAR